MVGIAIIGMACRFPGGIDTIDDLWSALENRVNTASEVPDRPLESRTTTTPKTSGRPRRPMFAAPISSPRTFGRWMRRSSICRRASRKISIPQQRLMLEVVWEAFENAGLSLPAQAGRDVGVYVGGFMLDHMITLMDPTNRTLINANTAAGMMMTMLSNRISHAFDLRGPSLSIDTACSSSLTAFNYGCQDIWRGACDTAHGRRRQHHDPPSISDRHEQGPVPRARRRMQVVRRARRRLWPGRGGGRRVC